MKPINELRIAICCDHAGFVLKNKVIAYLQSQKVKELKDFGTYSEESVDYPDFAHPMAAAVENAEYDFGISICGTGNGINMVANRHKGIRSALCWTREIASLARGHNNANVLALPGRFLTETEAYGIVDAFFTSDYEGGRHQRRIDKINIM